MIFFPLIIILLAAVLIYAMIMAQGVKPKPKRGVRGHVDKEMIAGRWNTIKLTSETGVTGLKNSVAEADKLVDHVLREMGFPGDNMGDRLRSAEKRFAYSEYNALWQAHKLRNSLAHDVGFDFVPSMAKDALRAFERALKDLDAL